MSVENGEKRGFGLQGFGSRIARRLLVGTLTVGLVGALILLPWDYFWNYEERVTDVNKNIEAVGEIFTPALIQSIWAIDREQIQLQMQGLSGFPYVTAAELQLEAGEVLRFGGENAGEDVISRSFPLIYTQAGRTHNLGTLILTNDFGLWRQRLVNRLVRVFIADAAVILLIALAVMLVYHVVVTKRLVAISQAVRDIAWDDLRHGEPQLPSSPAGHGRDELDELADIIARLWKTGGDALNDAEQKGAKLEAIFDGAQDGILVADIETKRLLAANPKICGMLGYHESDLNRMCVEDIHAASDLPEVTRSFEALGRRDITIAQDIPMLRKDGSKFLADVSTAVLAIDGRPVMAGFFRDMTDRKRAEEELIRHRDHLEELVEEQVKDLVVAKTAAENSKQMLQLVLDNIPVRVFWKDTDLKYLGCNRLFAADAGFSDTDALIGRDDYAMAWRDQAELYRADDSAVIDSGIPRYGYEEPQTTPDGGTIWLRTSKVPLRDETAGVVGVLGTYEDITGRKEAEAQLRAARDAAQKASTAKSEFLANMSHEIRTPLNAVLGMARIGYRDSRESGAKDNFTHILTSGQHLLGVINDVLDYSRIEAGKLAVEKVPLQLRDSVEEAVSMVAERAAEKGLALSLDFDPAIPAWVVGDRLRLQQILVNLLTNAIKFTSEGRVSVDVSGDGESVGFRVNDTGIGISEDELARLFDPFEQADTSTTRRYGGSGLGLAISRNLARLMGGDVSVGSRLGQGSEFVLRLPLQATEPLVDADPVEGSGQKDRRLAGLRVLAAEDVEINRMIIEDLLDHEGADVVFAENGKQALDHVAESGAGDIDVVLMDVQMPVMDGLEATRRIRRLAPDLPVIGLTAHALDEQRQQCLDAGMVDHVTKPIDTDDLVTAIRRQLVARELHVG